MIRILTVNSNGMRKRKRILALGHLLTILRIGVCVVAKSHLRQRDLKMIKIPGYEIMVSFCRRSRNTRVGGGVAILVREHLTATVEYSRERDTVAVEVCSANVYPPTGDVKKDKGRGSVHTALGSRGSADKDST